jgi:hypothetical protein
MNAKRRRWTLWWLLASLLVGLPLAALLSVMACNPSIPATSTPTKSVDVAQQIPPCFQEVTAVSGIAHTYHNGEEAGHLAILESLGGGVALFDYDGDGLLDVFIAGGGYYDGPDKKLIKGLPGKLYHNLGNWKFEDVTAKVGLDQALMYSHAAAACDYDCDGYPDLLVTGWGRMALYHNEPDGQGGRKFVEVTEKSGLIDDSWSTSAAWADFDGDGFPDLYVCHYADWSWDKHPSCTYDGKTPDVCPPKNFKPLPHKLYHNNRDGTFTECGKAAGLRVPRTDKEYDDLTFLSNEAKQRLRKAAEAKEPEFGKGLGVVAVDFNSDGKPDVYVCNDTVDNFLYINRSVPGKIQFEEMALSAGVARDDSGKATGSMGVDAADPLNQGLPAIWHVNYENENHCLHCNLYLPPGKDPKQPQGRIFFSFDTLKTGISAIGQNYVSWGTNFVDLDHDGWLDLLIFNGHAIRFPKGQTKRAQRPVVMHNNGQGKFLRVNTDTWEYFGSEHCSRGVAFGDLDNDGKIDAVACNLNEPTAVLRNVADTTPNHWLGVELLGKDHHDVVGAKLILSVGGKEQTRYAKGGGSYASTNDPRHVFGLGKAAQFDKLTVIWPSGKEQEWQGLKVDQYWRLTEGEKDAQPPRGSR